MASGLNFRWGNDTTMHRCYFSDFVTVNAIEWGGYTRPYRTKDVGYVVLRDGRMLAQVYGTINPECPGMWFDNLDEAKAYVETQALVGIVINKLTR